MKNKFLYFNRDVLNGGAGIRLLKIPSLSALGLLCTLAIAQGGENSRPSHMKYSAHGDWLSPDYSYWYLDHYDWYPSHYYSWYPNYYYNWYPSYRYYNYPYYQTYWYYPYYWNYWYW
jgi:hypothetical protein